MNLAIKNVRFGIGRCILNYSSLLFWLMKTQAHICNRRRNRRSLTLSRLRFRLAVSDLIYIQRTTLDIIQSGVFYLAYLHRVFRCNQQQQIKLKCVRITFIF